MLDQARELARQGELEAAADLLAQLAATRPTSERAQLLVHAANYCRPTQRARAVELAREATGLAPALVRAWLALAAALDERREPKAVAEAAGQVARLKATPRELGDAARQLARVGADAQALEVARRMWEESGQAIHLATIALRVARQCADWAFAAELQERLLQAHQEGRTEEVAETPRTHVLWCADEAINIATVSAFARKIFPQQQPLRTQARPLEGGRKLRVGYLSSDYRDHATSLLALGLLRHHDRSRFELFGYCTSFDDGSALRREMLSRFDQVRMFREVADRAAAQQIASDGIDVLIDLNGLTEGTRAGIMAWRPAPVQMAYLGFPGTAGGRFFDYIIGDWHTVPAGAEQLYPERVIRLSHTYQINDYAARWLPPAPSRASQKLPESMLVIGMFNNVNKLSAQVWACWMRILKQARRAVLWIIETTPVARERILAATREHGVDPARIIFAPKVRQEQHIARLRCCDLILDPWPYGGHTTTSDALFAGVPVVALEGSNFASRVSGGLLRAAGLGELVAPDEPAYEELATTLLGDRDRLKNLSAGLLDNVHRLPVFDAQTRTRQIEQACLTAHERAVSGRPPEHLDLAGGSDAAAAVEPGSVQASMNLGIQVQLPQVNISHLRVAVVTPYYRIEPEKLQRCIDSVRGQTITAMHFVVADDTPLPLAEHPMLEHVVLPRNVGNYGATPRSIGAMLAFSRGYDAVAFLDADNWFEPDHLSRALMVLEQHQLHLVFARRRIVFPDGEELLMSDSEDDAQRHVDTNVWIVSSRARFLAAAWANYPRDFGAGEDRLLLYLAKHHRLTSAWLAKPTVWYETNWSAHYSLARKPHLQPVRAPARNLRTHFEPETFRRAAGFSLDSAAGEKASAPVNVPPGQWRIAVVTPYRGEPAQQLRACVAMVAAQRGEVVHYVVGAGSAAILGEATEHLVPWDVNTGHDPSGNLARGLGSTLAFQYGAQAVAYVEVGTQWNEHHLRGLVTMCEQSAADIAVARCAVRAAGKGAGQPTGQVADGAQTSMAEEDIANAGLISDRAAFAATLWAQLPPLPGRRLANGLLMQLARDAGAVVAQTRAVVAQRDAQTRVARPAGTIGQENAHEGPESIQLSRREVFKYTGRRMESAATPPEPIAAPQAN